MVFGGDASVVVSALVVVVVVVVVVGSVMTTHSLQISVCAVAEKASPELKYKYPTSTLALSVS